ncbi:VanZ family protein [Candidatus Nitrospira salsa]
MMKKTKQDPHVSQKATTSEHRHTLQPTQYLTPHQQKSVGFICYWLPLFLYAGAIVLVSSLSTPKVHFEAMAQAYLSISGRFFLQLNDKIVHLIEYAILGLLTYRAIRFSWGSQLGAFSAFITIIAVGLFGCTDEFHQWFIPLRKVEVLDLMADIAGGFIGIALWEWGRTLPAIREIEEQIPLKLQLIRELATSKKKTPAPSLPDTSLKD